MKKLVNSIFKPIGMFVDKRIVTPITKLVVRITTKFDSSGKQVIHGHFVLYHVIVIVVGNTIRCNHDEV